MPNPPQIIVKLNLYKFSEGGRSVPILPPKFACTVNIDNQFHDIRIYIDKQNPIKPGDEVNIPMQFLYPDLVIPKLSKGKKFFLTEGQRKIGVCEVIEIG
jgi:translation elongation factor EF-Tu-like GTPase